MRSLSKRDRLYMGKRWSWLKIRSTIFGKQKESLFKEVKTFVLFIGYPRSGHSLIGSLLDAHPNMVISNQLDALSLFYHNYTRNQIFYLIWKNTKKESNKGRSNSGYKFEVPNQWQGKHQTINVIGDKRGGKSSRLLAQAVFRSAIQDLPNRTKSKLKILHLIRNPYDNISTMMTRATKRPGRIIDETLFKEKLDSYFTKVNSNNLMIQEGNFDILNIHFEDFIKSPQSELAKICYFLEVEPNIEYLKDCASIVWPQPNYSRFKIDIWTENRKARVAEEMIKIDWLERYSFE